MAEPVAPRQDGDDAGAAPAAAGATRIFDDFSLYYIQLVLVVIWMLPMVLKLFNKKRSNLQTKLRALWSYNPFNKSLNEA